MILYQSGHIKRLNLLCSRVVPATAHAAFDKAGEYFNVKVHSIPVDSWTRRVDMKRVARAMYVIILSSSCRLPLSYPYSQQCKYDYGMSLCPALLYQLIQLSCSLLGPQLTSLMDAKMIL